MIYLDEQININKSRHFVNIKKMKILKYNVSNFGSLLLKTKKLDKRI